MNNEDMLGQVDWSFLDTTIEDAKLGEDAADKLKQEYLDNAPRMGAEAITQMVKTVGDLLVRVTEGQEGLVISAPMKIFAESMAGKLADVMGKMMLAVDMAMLSPEQAASTTNRIFMVTLLNIAMLAVYMEKLGYPTIPTLYQYIDHNLDAPTPPATGT